MTKNYIRLILAMLLYHTEIFHCLSQSSLIKTFANTTISSNIGGFLVYVPSDYNTTGKYYPLLIIDHGQGENGNGSNPFNAITTNGPLKEINLSHTYIPGLYDQFIIMGPQFKGYPQTEDTDSSIQYMKKNYRIRGDVFLTGLSQGGGGVWNSASSSTVTKLAAVVPICGASAPSPYKIGFLAPNNLPVWAFHGTADPTVPVTQSQDWVNMINAYIPTPNPVAKLTTFLGVGHDSWTTVYAGYSESGINIYQWMLGYDTSPKQTITGLNGISNKLVGEYFGLGASASSLLPVSYQIVSTPSIGIFTTLTGNQLSCTGIGVVTITAVQYGNNIYAPASNMASIFSITGYLGTISGMPSDNSQIYYGSSAVTISGGSALNPLNLSYASIPPSGVITVIGNSIKTLGIGNVTLTGSLSNQTLTSTFDIVPTILTVAASQNYKIYGQSNPIFSSTVSGLANGDLVNVSYFSNANNLSGIGNYSIYPSVTGSALVNYQLTTSSGILTIQKAIISINIANANKIYGQSNPIFTGTVSGLMNGDIVNVSYFSNANNLSGIGNYSIYPSVTGSALVNYQLSTVTGILAVQKAALTINIANANKTYGQINPTFTGTISGLMNGDVVNVSYFSNASNFSGIGNYSIYPSVTGSALVNYQITTSSGILAIQKAIISINIANANKIYGQSNPIFTGTVSGLMNGDVVNTIYFSSANNLSGIGNYSIYPSVTGAALINYQLSTVAGILAVQKAALTVSVVDAIKTYGQSNPTFTCTVSGLMNGDLVNVSYFSNASNFSGIGNYSIYPSVTGAALVNYQITTSSGILAIQKAIISINIANANKTYGQINPIFTGTISGLMNGDVVNTIYFSSANNLSGIGNYSIYPSVTGSALVNYQITTSSGILAIQKAIISINIANANKTYGQNNPIFTSTVSGLMNGDVVNVSYFSNANNLSGIGNYSIYPAVTGASLINYQLSTIAGILAVQKAVLAVNVANTIKTYGQSNPTFTCTVLGLMNGDVVNVSYFSNANNLSGIGNYSIYPSVTGSVLVNYQLITSSGILSIQKATISIIAANASKTYGLPNPVFVCTISGLANGDLVNVSYITNVDSLSETGNYPIYPSISGSALTNYQQTTIAGVLAVQKAMLLINTANANKTYGQINPIFSGTVSGLIKRDVVNVSYFSNANTFSNAGDYSILSSISGDALVNYQLTTIAGVLVVAKSELTVTATNMDKVAGDLSPAPFSYSIVGFVNDENENVFINPIQIGTTAPAKASFGNYPITVSGASALNYDFTYKSGVLRILFKIIESSPRPTISGVAILNTNNTLTLTGNGLSLVQSICFQTTSEIFCVIPTINRDSIITINPPYSLLKTGTISVTGNFGIAEYSLAIVSSNQEFAPEKSIDVYPNPTNGVFIINGIERANLDIYSLQGQKLKSVAIENQASFELTEQGIYFLYIKTEKSLAIKKLIVY